MNFKLTLECEATGDMAKITISGDYLEFLMEKGPIREGLGSCVVMLFDALNNEQ